MSLTIAKYSEAGSSTDVVEKNTSGTNFISDGAMEIFGNAMAKHMTAFHEQQLAIQDNKLAAMASLFASKLNDIGSQFNMVDNKVQKMQEEINSMKGTTANSSDSMYLDRITRDIWPIIPKLFCSKTGTCAWVPVEYENENGDTQKVIVVSLRMLQYLIPIYNHRISNVAIKCCFDSLGSINSNIQGDNRKSGNSNFEKIMMKTPFRVYKTGKRLYIKSNVFNYSIIPVEEWKRVLGDISRLFPNKDVGKIVIDKIPNERITMIQRFAMKAVSKSDSRTCKIEEFGNKQFDIGVRRQWPSMFVPWWSQLYTDTVKEFFDIPLDVEDFGYVVEGKYDESGTVNDFDELFEKIFPDKPHLKYDILEESSEVDDYSGYSSESEDESESDTGKRTRNDDSDYNNKRVKIE